MAQIKFVADVTDDVTRNVLKEKWENASPSLQKQILNRMGHSDKWVGSKFSDLTGEIQSKIVILQFNDEHEMASKTACIIIDPYGKPTPR